MDEIKNKIHLVTTNVNKKNANKRKGDWIERKKINWRVDLIFCMAYTQIHEEIEGKERKKSHFRPNHYTRVIHIGKGLQDE